MPLSMAELEELRAEAFAEDMDIPATATSWDRARVVAYFETAGESEKPGGGGKAAPMPAKTAWAAPPPSAQSQLPVPNISGAFGKPLLAPMTFEVVHMFVRVRAEPRLDGKELGMLRKGMMITADAVHEDWVRIEENALGDAALPPPTGSSGKSSPMEYPGGWMLADGAAVKLGMLLEPKVTPLPPGTTWRATRPGGGLAYPKPGGDAIKGNAGEHLDKELQEVEVVAECGLWARVQLQDGRRLWMEMDVFFAG